LLALKIINTPSDSTHATKLKTIPSQILSDSIPSSCAISCSASRIITKIAVPYFARAKTTIRMK